MTSCWTLLHTGGLWLCFRAFWDTLETITRSKQVRSWRRIACVFFSVIMRFTPNFSILACFFLLNVFGKDPQVVYMSVWQNIHYFTEQLVIHEWSLPCPSCPLFMWYILRPILPPLPEVGCPKFLELWNPWGKVLERSGLRIKHFCWEVV